MKMHLPRGTDRSAHPRTVAALLAVAVLMLGVPAVIGASSGASEITGIPSLPGTLPTSLVTSAGTWATVPMGELDHPLNTFWQLFFLPKSGARWINHASSLATATNGGLILASPSGSSLLVGVRPANLLYFSPLVSTSGGGESWSPGLPLPGAADSLAAEPGGGELALVEHGATAEVLATTPNASSWRTLTTNRALEATTAGKSCGITSLTAVGYANGSPLVGGTCRRSGEVGLFAERQGSWQMAGPVLPASLRVGTVEVLHVGATSTGLSALLALRGPTGSSLLAAWRAATASTWSLSQPVNLGPGDRVSSFGPASGTGLYIALAGAGNVNHIEVVSGPGTSWTALPVLVAPAVTVAFGSNGRVDALVPNASKLADYVLAGRSKRWQLAETISVGILYGSSG